MSANSETRRVESAVCAGCGTLCDDVVLIVEGDRARAERGLCERGEAWLRALGPLQSRAWIGRNEARLDTALERCRSLLREARAPWLVIGPRLGLEATRAAVRVAELARASILIAAEERFDPRAGIDGPDLSASRGEVSGSAELIILLRADPSRDLPRFMERHVLRRGDAREGTPRPRIVLVDTPRALESHATKEEADEVISLRPGDPERAALAWVRELAIEIEALFEAKAFEATELASPASDPADVDVDIHGHSESESETSAGESAAKRLARVILGAPHAHVYVSPTAARDR
ncbi:MAG TPA: hypothetical protein VK116_06430, partial [Planctomycetota bacterium]|nr:hypothetical protein [Planctomycetota bacterium]